MESNWSLVFTDTDVQHLNFLKKLLDDQNIPSRLVDRSDSVFPTIGESELYVDSSFEAQALRILEDFQK